MAAKKLSAGRRKAASALDKAVQAELPPLKLERARFMQIATDEESRDGAGFDRVEFWAQTNPGTPGPLLKVASGGELSRFMLALKVVLADKGSAPTLVFDEIDTGVGGAVADAIGQRLARRGAGPGHRRDARSPGRRESVQPFPDREGGRSSSDRVATRVTPLARKAAAGGDRPHARRRDHHRRGEGGRGTAARISPPLTPSGLATGARPLWCAGERVLTAMTSASARPSSPSRSHLEQARAEHEALGPKSPSTTGAITKRTRRPSRCRIRPPAPALRGPGSAVSGAEDPGEPDASRRRQSLRKVRQDPPRCRCCRWRTASPRRTSEFVERIRRFLQLKPGRPGLHGGAQDRRALPSLRYERGRLVGAATRGDGAEGEDVTANARTVGDISKRFEAGRHPGGVRVRGEIYLSHADFAAINERQAAAGKPLFANPRNAAAGACGSSIPSITASRPLHFFAYAAR